MNVVFGKMVLGRGGSEVLGVEGLQEVMLAIDMFLGSKGTITNRVGVGWNRAQVGIRTIQIGIMGGIGIMVVAAVENGLLSFVEIG